MGRRFDQSFHGRRYMDAFIYLFILKMFLPRSLWDLSSPTRDQTQALGSESAKSYPLDHQGISWMHLNTGTDAQL